MAAKTCIGLSRKGLAMLVEEKRAEIEDAATLDVTNEELADRSIAVGLLKECSVHPGFYITNKTWCRAEE